MNIYIILGREYSSPEEIIISDHKTYLRRKMSFIFPVSFSFAGVKSTHKYKTRVLVSRRVQPAGTGSECSCLCLGAYMNSPFSLFALSS